jgi:hypothetical protein
MQSYGGIRLIPNIPVYFSPTYSDNSTHRRQTALTASKLVACKKVPSLFAGIVNVG